MLASVRRAARRAAPTSVAALQAAVAHARHISDFAYVVPGRVAPRRHNVVFDERQRDEVWKSDMLPVVTVDPAVVAAADAKRAAHLHAKIMALKAKHPQTFLVALLRVRSEASGAPLPLSDAELAPLLAGPSEAEAAALSNERGRIEKLAASRAQLRKVVVQLQEQEAVLCGEGSAHLSASARAAAAAAATKTLATAACTALRTLSLAQYARIQSLPEHRRAAAEAEWLASYGVTAADAAGGAGGARSPRIPSDLFAVKDAPMTTPLTTEELKNSNAYLEYDSAKRLAMEHRDRAEWLSQRKLPPPLHADAPNKLLADAALALEDNPSLTPADREYMLHHYSNALLGKEKEAFDFTAETKSWVATQPQWGWYDPALPNTQDDATDAVSGRGKFSRYRGGAVALESLPPASYGEVDVAGQHVPSRSTSIAPLETAEEAALAGAQVEAQLAAEAAAATAAVTAAIERSMGLKPRGAPRAAAAAAATAGAEPSFFKRYASGAKVSAPAPPAKGERREVERVEPEAAAGGKAAAGKAGAKGGKPGAAPAKPAGKK